MKTVSTMMAAALMLGASFAAQAQFAVSANDGKQLRPGENPGTRTPDSVSVLDLSSYPPKTVATIDVPASLVGPPHAVAIARTGRFALVTAAQRLNAAGALEPDDTVSVVDLGTLSAPRLAQAVKAGPGASGVAINPADTLALVASTGDDAISIFRIDDGRLSPAGKVQLPPKSRPTDIAFTPDGTTALVVAQGAGKLIELSVDGATVKPSGRAFNPGVQPYGVVVSPDGRFAYNTNLGGRPRPAGSPPPAGGASPIGTISSIDLKGGAIDTVDVGQTPEHLTLSADGRYLAAVVANGSAADADAPGYHPYGLLQIYRVAGGRMTRVAEARSGAWCQGAAFSADSRMILLQCAMTKVVEVYRFDGRTLTQDKSATLTFNARPGAIALATSH